MGRIYELVLDRSVNYPPKVKTQAEKFAKKLQSFCYCPLSDKEYSRMKPFAVQEEVVNLVFEIVKDCEIPDSDNYDAIFDVVGYWYCIALLSMSQNTDILEFLDSLTDSLIKRKHRNASLLMRNFENFKELPTLKKMYDKISRYFIELDKAAPVYELLDSIGVAAPRGAAWRFTFTLANYDKFELEKNLSDEEKEQRLDLKFEFHSPYGDGECFVVSLKNCTNMIYMTNITNLDPFGSIYFPDRIVKITSAPSVMLIKETIAEIERVCETRFNRKMLLSYFPKEVKGKKLFEKWLEQ